MYLSAKSVIGSRCYCGTRLELRNSSLLTRFTSVVFPSTRSEFQWLARSLQPLCVASTPPPPGHLFQIRSRTMADLMTAMPQHLLRVSQARTAPRAAAGVIRRQIFPRWPSPAAQFYSKKVPAAAPSLAPDYSSPIVTPVLPQQPPPAPPQPKPQPLQPGAAYSSSSPAPAPLPSADPPIATG